MPLIARPLALFFHHLYHSLAFAYDGVASVVSFGEWIDWTKTTLPFIQGTRVLEIGHGPGHLQHILYNTPNSGYQVFGLDESRQMIHIAHRRLVRAGISSPRLTRGLAQSIPFPPDTFDTIVSTFPARYIFELQTISEIHRTLRSQGRLVVLPAVWPKSLPLKWLYRVTGESPGGSMDTLRERITQQFLRVGFACRVEIIEIESSFLLLLIASKERGFNA